MGSNPFRTTANRVTTLPAGETIATIVLMSSI